MCFECWRDQYNSSYIINDKTKKAVKLIKEVYKYHGAGGSLHIILDDWNLEDSHVDFCGKVISLNEYDDPPELLDAELKCYEALKKMSIEERASALAIERGYGGGGR